MLTYLISALLGYLAGSFPTAYLLVKWKANLDIRQVGSGNVGTLNTMEITNSKSLGVAVLVIDMVKGALPVVLALHFFGNEFELLGTAGVSAIIGHSFPVWLRFRGGRGLATTAGVMLVIGWIFILIWLSLCTVAYLSTRNVHWGSVLASLFSPMLIAIIPDAFLGQTLPLYTSTTNLLYFSITFCTLLILTHWEPITASIKK